MLDSHDQGRCCNGNLEVVVHDARRREQGDQTQLDIGAVAVGNVLIAGSRGGPLAVVAASQFALLNDFHWIVLVATAEADDNTSLQATKHALKRNGRKDKTGCDPKTHDWESIRRSKGDVQ